MTANSSYSGAPDVEYSSVLKDSLAVVDEEAALERQELEGAAAIDEEMNAASGEANHC